MNDEDEDSNEDEGFSGPALPPGYRAESSGSESDGGDDDIVGPMPFKGDRPNNSVAQDFERRAQKMKDKLTGVNVSVMPVSAFLCLTCGSS